MHLDALKKYDSFGLEALKESPLISNREDRKYIIPINRVDEVLLRCFDHYNILEIEGERIFDYSNTYYDTKELSMYHLHHRGKKNRCKVRKREYLKTNETFFEVKINNNKNKTIKHRIQTQAFEDAIEKIKEFSFYDPSLLHPVLNISYKRITLMHKNLLEKITLDLAMKCKADGNQVSFEQIVFAEVKTINSHEIEFCNIMKNLIIRGGSLSKYCLGIICLFIDVKHNNFKIPFIKIKKSAAHAIS